MEGNPVGFVDFFRSIPDHRIERKKLHPVEELLLVTFCGVMAGCESWDDLELFGKTKLDYLQESGSVKSNRVLMSCSAPHPECHETQTTSIVNVR